MNGWTKTVSIAISLLVVFGGLAFGYGTLNNRVLSLEKRTDGIQIMMTKITTIEADVKWIKEKFLNR